ncbi:hypothetical protein C7441_1106 [Pseudaminobacter salicylatoxidans]|uniref:Uncharacterized protein n=1 Tax=Pseudaminobacter salicylatoxidans TaxID=93369 RepID=A0A316CM13_PSESE|nr:hypothetical protein [Pseudaminobacter salicylatoxidans]PWJ81475.1 hypothetical protein C7441_1106 [Pseudaminobacter salicylatoxidans]
MSIVLPKVDYQRGRPRLNDPVSMSRYGNRAISFIQNGDKYWTADIETRPLYDDELAAIEAWLARARNGMETVIYTPIGKQRLPRAYWDDPNSLIPAKNGTLNTITNGTQLSVSGVAAGLSLTDGDLLSLTTGAYHSLHRVMADAAAAGTSLTVAVDPPVMSYISAGATVTFKEPKMNARVVPGSVDVGDGVLPTAKFQLIEVPR